LDENKPPTDQAPLCERLRHLGEDSNNTASLIDRYVSFDQATPSLKTWFTKFGVESRKSSLMFTIKAGKDVENVME
jgi:hypothetical protein